MEEEKTEGKKWTRVAIDVVYIFGNVSWCLLGIAMVICFILDAAGVISLSALH